MDGQGLGLGFYLRLAAVVIAIAIGFLILMLIITKAVYAWGLFGALLALALVLVLVGWVTDRRDARRSPEPPL